MDTLGGLYTELEGGGDVLTGLYEFRTAVFFGDGATPAMLLEMGSLELVIGLGGGEDFTGDLKLYESESR